MTYILTINLDVICRPYNLVVAVMFERHGAGFDVSI